MRNIFGKQILASDLASIQEIISSKQQEAATTVAERMFRMAASTKVMMKVFKAPSLTAEHESKVKPETKSAENPEVIAPEKTRKVEPGKAKKVEKEEEEIFPRWTQ